MSSVRLRTCGNCAARFRFAQNLPTIGPCCPICLKPVKPVARLRQIAGTPTPGLDAVYVDASFREGVAGLAVVGVLGEYTRRVSVGTSSLAERWALQMAMEIASGLKRRDLVFRSDASSVVSGFGGRPSMGWTFEHVPRDLNRRAHELASVARKRTT